MSQISGIDQPLIDVLCRDIHKIHEQSDQLLKKWRSGPKKYRKKINQNGQADVVTSLDFAIERLIISILGNRMPIFGEELSEFSSIGESPLYAIVDPIDGTKEFFGGGSEWGISISIIHLQKPTISSIYLPDRGEKFLAVKGQGVKLNGQQYVRKKQTMNNKIAVSPRQIKHPHLSKKISDIGYNAHPVPALTPKICAILRGDVEMAVYIPQTNQSAAIWDYAAAPLLLSEIGGCITSCDGQDLSFDIGFFNHTEGWVASSNSTAHSELVESFKNSRLT